MGDSACAEAACPAGIDACGARGDFARHCGGPIDALDGQVAWPRAVDNKPGDQAQWRLIDIGRRWPMRMPGDEAVVRKAASWRTTRGYDGQLRGSSNRIGRPSR